VRYLGERLGSDARLGHSAVMLELAQPSMKGLGSRPDRLLFWWQPVRLPRQEYPYGPGYQTAFAEQIRREANILTGRKSGICHVILSGPAHPGYRTVRTRGHHCNGNSCGIRIGTLVGRRMIWGSQYRWPIQIISELRRKAHKPAFQ